MLLIHLASAGWLKRRKVAWPRQMVHPWERGERVQLLAGNIRVVPESAGKQSGIAGPEMHPREGSGLLLSAEA